jgi:uncharacterized protein YraI
MSIFLKSLAVLLVSAFCHAVWTPTAHASASFCAVVLLTPDGFLNLRAGPGATYPIVGKMVPGDQISVDTGSCRNKLCDETQKWQFVEWVERLDGPPEKAKRRFTQGWTMARFIKQVKCDDE